jgi:hypothetical protein
MASTEEPQASVVPATPGRRVDAGTVRTLELSYSGLVKAGQDSVRAAWRFGQCVDSFTDSYLLSELADAMGLSVGTLYRYRRLYAAYQRPELALRAAQELETFNIDTIWRLQDDLHPVPHGRPLAGRHWRFRCHNCQSTDVHREETDADGNPVSVSDERLEAIVNGPETGTVPEAQFSSGSLCSPTSRMTGARPSRGCPPMTGMSAAGGSPRTCTASRPAGGTAR